MPCWTATFARTYPAGLEQVWSEAIYAPDTNAAWEACAAVILSCVGPGKVCVESLRPVNYDKVTKGGKQYA